MSAQVWDRALGKCGVLQREQRARLIVTHDPRFVAMADRVVVRSRHAPCYRSMGPRYAAAAVSQTR